MSFTQKGETRNGHIVNDEGRTCVHCREFKGWDNYSNNKRLLRGKANLCKTCAKVTNEKFRKKASETNRENDRKNKLRYYHENKDRLQMINQAKYYERHYGVSAEVVLKKKDEGCEVCGSHEHLQVDKHWNNKKEVHILCKLCKGTLRKYETPEHSLHLLRSFTLQQAIRKGLH